MKHQISQALNHTGHLQDESPGEFLPAQDSPFAACSCWSFPFPQEKEPTVPGHWSFTVCSASCWEDAQEMIHAAVTLLDISQLRGLVPTGCTEQPAHSRGGKAKRTWKRMRAERVSLAGILLTNLHLRRRLRPLSVEVCDMFQRHQYPQAADFMLQILMHMPKCHRLLEWFWIRRDLKGHLLPTTLL